MVKPTGSLSETILNMLYCLRHHQYEGGVYEFVLKGMFGSGNANADPGAATKITNVLTEYKSVKLDDSSDKEAYKDLHPDTDETVSSSDEM